MPGPTRFSVAFQPLTTNSADCSSTTPALNRFQPKTRDIPAEPHTRSLSNTLPIARICSVVIASHRLYLGFPLPRISHTRHPGRRAPQPAYPARIPILAPGLGQHITNP